MNLKSLVFLVSLLLTTLQTIAQPNIATQKAADIATQRLEQELTQLAKGKVGVCAVHLESGKQVSMNLRERFPMASTVKVAIAVFVGDSPMPLAEREQTIAHSARAIYDYFLYQPPVVPTSAR